MMDHRRKARSGDDAGSTRDRILVSALEAFSESGYEGASTREIARLAGVNQGLISYYFGNKLALWKAAVNRAFAELAEGLGDELKSPDQRSETDRLRTLLRRYVRFAGEHPAFVRIMNDEGKRAGARTDWLVEHHSRPFFAALAERIEQAQAAGLLDRHVAPIHSIYMLIGAATLIFHQAQECRRLSGEDATAAEAIEAHADALEALIFGA